MQVTTESIIQIPGSYTVDGDTFQHAGMVWKEHFYENKTPLNRRKTKAARLIKTQFEGDKCEYLVGLNGTQVNRQFGRHYIDNVFTVAGPLITINLETYKRNPNSLKLVFNPKSPCVRYQDLLRSYAISTLKVLKVIVGLGFTGAFVASTAAVCTMAYAQRTIVHFVPAVVETMVNGTLTHVPNPFNATALNATCVNDTARNAADQYCVYEQRVLSEPHIIAAGIMIPFAFYFATQAIASVRSFVCRTGEKEKQD